jgi:hypothetical protein
MWGREEKTVWGEEKSVSPEPLALTCKAATETQETLRRLFAGKRREDCMRGKEDKTVCGEKKRRLYAGMRNTRNTRNTETQETLRNP